MNTKNITLKALLPALGLYFITFLIFYLGVYVGAMPTAVTYVSLFVRDFALFVIPLLLSLALAAVYVGGKIKRTLIYALYLSLARLAYALPSYYVTYSLDGAPLPQAALLLLIQAVLSLLISYAVLLLLLFTLVFAYGKLTKNSGSPCAALDKKCDTGSYFDLHEPLNLAYFATAGVMFVFYLIREMLDTVPYLINYAGSYRLGEIIYISVRYVFILASFIFSYWLLSLYRDKVICKISKAI